MGKWAGPLSEMRAGIFPYEHLVPPTGMKNAEMRMCRRNYVIDFSNFQVNISINVKFHPGRRDENNQEKFIPLSGPSRLPGSCQRPFRTVHIQITFHLDQSQFTFKCFTFRSLLTSIRDVE